MFWLISGIVIILLYVKLLRDDGSSNTYNYREYKREEKVKGRD